MSVNNFISVVNGAYSEDGKIRAVELMLERKYLFNQTEFEYAVSSEIWGQYAKEMVNRLIDLNRALAHCHEKWIPVLVSMGANVKSFLKRSPFTGEYLGPSSNFSVINYASFLATQFHDEQICNIELEYLKTKDTEAQAIESRVLDYLSSDDSLPVTELEYKIDDFLSKIEDTREFRTLAALIELAKH